MNNPVILPPKNILLEIKDYVMITVGLLCYAAGWTFFLLPFQITSGGTAGIGAIIQYATGFEMQYTYILINSLLLIFAVRILGYKFCLKTIYAVFVLTFFLGVGQVVFLDQNALIILGEGHILESTIVGSCFCGLGIAICFLNNGSTGGTDIVAAMVNKYREITFGRIILYADMAIICSSYLVVPDLAKVFYGFITMVITTTVLDYIINSNRQSVQFFIFSKKYEEISHYITMARRSQANQIFRIVKQLDPNAFISQSRVTGVYGNGFDKIKVK